MGEGGRWEVIVVDDDWQDTGYTGYTGYWLLNTTSPPGCWVCSMVGSGRSL